MTERDLMKLLQTNPDLSVDGYDAPSPSAAVQAGRRNKFNAQRTEMDGRTFDSKAESVRYAELRLREQAGEISNLRCQVKFPIAVNGVHVCDYIADFTYYADGQFVVEDVKGMKTPVYRLKKKLTEAIYKFEIVEVGR